MQESDFFSLFTDRIRELSIDYMVTGSAVVVAFGEPRLTNDIDLVLKLTENQLSPLFRMFPAEEFFVPPEEVLVTEIGRRARGHFNLIHHRTGLKADCYLVGADSFLNWGLENKKNLEIGGHEVSFAPLEYVIIKKLQFYQEGGSEKHLRDIRGLLQISGSLVDRELLLQFVSKFNLQAVWEAVR